MNFIKNYLSFTVAVIITALLLTGFVNTNSPFDTKKLAGTWVYKSYKDGVYTYAKSGDFKANKPGFQFNSKGKMVKRLDPNWCVRVKGPYTNLEGTYELMEDNVLKTSYQCPVKDNPSINQYQIIELSKKKLVLKSLPRE